MDVRCIMPWLFIYISTGHAVIEMAMRSTKPGSGDVNLCRSLCGTHDYLGHLQSIDLSPKVHVGIIVAEVGAIVQARVRASM